MQIHCHSPFLSLVAWILNFCAGSLKWKNVFNNDKYFICTSLKHVAFEFNHASPVHSVDNTLQNISKIIFVENIKNEKVIDIQTLKVLNLKSALD